MEAPTINLDGVEPWAPGGVILRGGIHPIRVVEEEFEESNGHPVVKLGLEATGGEERGGEIRDWVHITAESKGRVAQVYKAFQVEVPAGDFKWIPLKDREAKAIVREEPKYDDPSKTVSKVKGYTTLAEGDVVEKLKDAFDATEVDADKDIPF